MNHVNDKNFWEIFTQEYVYQSCLDFSLLLDHSETPETYPLLHRFYQIDNWRAAFPNGNLLALWVGYAQFIINFAKNLNPSSMPDEYFMCIAFYLYYPDKDPFLRPYIIVGKQQIWEHVISNCCLIKNKKHSPEMKQIMNAFESCPELKDFSFYESRFRDPAVESEIVWIYCL